MGGTGLEQHGHAAGVANNSPVGCCLVRGFQRLGMSTKKAPPAGAPFAPPRLDGTGREQGGSALFSLQISLYRGCSFLGKCDILGLVQQIGVYKGEYW